MSFSLRSVHLRDLAEDEVLVRTAYSGVSIGTEFALIRGKISWGAFPLVTGYMATGVVEKVGEAVSTVGLGDRVFLRANRGMELEDGTQISAVSGTHCSHIITRVGGTHGLGVLPAGGNLETTSLFVLPAVGYKGVDMAAPNLGETVVVYGCGSIGLGVVAAATLRGCRVIAIDVLDRQLDLAAEFGADVLINSGSEKVSEAVMAICPDGADAVFECTGIPALVEPAMRLARTGGKFVWQGNYGEAPINFSFLTPHGKRLTTYFPCDDGYMPCRNVVIKHMTKGILPWEETITHRVAAADSPALFENILQGDRSVIGATIRWS